MTFKVLGLEPSHFRSLAGLSDEELSTHRALRIVAQAGSAMPDRIEMRDAVAGESVLLVNFEHQPADNPFRASHAVYVLENAAEAAVYIDELPPALRTRLLSVRAFDGGDMMVAADVAEGGEAAALIGRLLADGRVSYLHVHYARMGCFAARVERHG